MSKPKPQVSNILKQHYPIIKSNNIWGINYKDDDMHKKMIEKILNQLSVKQKPLKKLNKKVWSKGNDESGTWVWFFFNESV